MKRTSIALLSSAWVFALFLTMTVAVTPAQAVCQEDGCNTGEGEGPGLTVNNEDSNSDGSEGDAGPSESDNESSSDSSEGGGPS